MGRKVLELEGASFHAPAGPPRKASGPGTITAHPALAHTHFDFDSARHRPRLLDLLAHGVQGIPVSIEHRRAAKQLDAPVNKQLGSGARVVRSRRRLGRWPGNSLSLMGSGRVCSLRHRPGASTARVRF